MTWATSVMEGHSEPIPIPGNPKPASEDSAETVRLYSQLSGKLRAYMRAAKSVDDLNRRFEETSTYVNTRRDTAIRRGDDKDTRMIWKRFYNIHSDMETMYDKMAAIIDTETRLDSEGAGTMLFFGEME